MRVNDVIILIPVPLLTQKDTQTLSLSSRRAVNAFDEDDTTIEYSRARYFFNAQTEKELFLIRKK